MTMSSMLFKAIHSCFVLQIPMCQPSTIRRKQTMKSLKSLKHRRNRESTYTAIDNMAAVQEGQSMFYYEVESPPPSLANSVELVASGENSYVSVIRIIGVDDSVCDNFDDNPGLVIE